MDRYAPDLKFPPYAFVPGRHPHPITHPDGHSFGTEEPELTPPTWESLPTEPEFRFALDLFNFGYYWEAHESWEGLWHAAGRVGPLADFLKGLIRLAAAGVKSREGNRDGVVRHAQKAAEYLAGHTELVETANAIANHPPIDRTKTKEGRVVLPIPLELEWFQNLGA